MKRRLLRTGPYLAACGPGAGMRCRSAGVRYASRRDGRPGGKLRREIRLRLAKNQRRVEAAIQRLLEPDVCLSWVAHDSGFADQAAPLRSRSVPEAGAFRRSPPSQIISLIRIPRPAPSHDLPDASVSSAG